MTNIGEFNPDQHEDAKSFEILPAGWYAMQTINAEVRKNSKAEGQHLWLELEMLEIPQQVQFKGRCAWDRLNMWNPKEQTVKIANSRLKQICKSIGLGTISDSDALLGKQIAVKLKVRPADGKYEAQNEIIEYDSFTARFQSGGVSPAANSSAAASASRHAQPAKKARGAGVPGYPRSSSDHVTEASGRPLMHVLPHWPASGCSQLASRDPTCVIHMIRALEQSANHRTPTRTGACHLPDR